MVYRGYKFTESLSPSKHVCLKTCRTALASHSAGEIEDESERPCTWTSNVCEIMAFIAFVMGLRPLSYIQLWVEVLVPTRMIVALDFQIFAYAHRTPKESPEQLRNRYGPVELGLGQDFCKLVPHCYASPKSWQHRSQNFPMVDCRKVELLGIFEVLQV